MSSGVAVKPYTADSLRSFITMVFLKLGVSQDDASVMAECYVHANLRGVDTHGVARFFPTTVKRVQSGVINSRTSIIVKSDRPSVALLDGSNSLGPVVGKRAMDIAIDKAAKTGAAFVSVSNSNNIASCAYYSMMAFPRDQIGITSTNSTALVAPWGGRQAMLGTNPISVAIPGDDAGCVVLDMATSTTIKGRLMIHDKAGTPLQEGWAFDASGRPTTDPKAALQGLLQPMGGYKGYGLSLVIELLTGILAGGEYAYHMGGSVDTDMTRPSGTSSLFGTISVEAFMDPAVFKSRVGRVIREIRESPKADGFARIYIPGEMESESWIQRTKEGIPLSEDVVRSLTELGKNMGVTFPAPMV